VTIARLYDLQQVDTALTTALARRQDLDDGSVQRELVAAAAEHLESIAERTGETQSQLRTLDLETRSLRAKRVKIEAEMYSGRIANPKELAAMQDDVASIGRHVSHLEDQELALMEQAEALDAGRSQAQQALEAAQADLTRIVDAYRHAASAADEEISTLRARREALAGEVEENLLRRYERLLEKKGGLGVVAVRGNACGGCHVAIPQRLLSQLARDPELVATCDGCGRMLIVLPGDSR
jgi:predicted  nucleic acid-binding Zn-ribbon protein